MKTFEKKDRQFYLVIAILMAMAIYVVWVCGAHAECYRSLDAARAGHRSAHITWSHGCYYAGYPHDRHSERHHERTAKSPPPPRQRPAAQTVPVPDPAPATFAIAAPPVKVKAYRIRHVPEFDTAADMAPDAHASFDRRFGSAYAAVRPEELSETMARQQALASISRQVREMGAEIEHLRAALQNARGK